MRPAPGAECSAAGGGEPHKVNPLRVMDQLATPRQYSGSNGDAPPMRRGALPIRAGGPVAAGAPERSKGGPGGGPPFAFRGETRALTRRFAQRGGAKCL